VKTASCRRRGHLSRHDADQHLGPPAPRLPRCPPGPPRAALQYLQPATAPRWCPTTRALCQGRRPRSSFAATTQDESTQAGSPSTTSLPLRLAPRPARYSRLFASRHVTSTRPHELHEPATSNVRDGLTARRGTHEYWVAGTRSFRTDQRNPSTAALRCHHQRPASCAVSLEDPLTRSPRRMLPRRPRERNPKVRARALPAPAPRPAAPPLPSATSRGSDELARRRARRTPARNDARASGRRYMRPPAHTLELQGPPSLSVESRIQHSGEAQGALGSPPRHHQPTRPARRCCALRNTPRRSA
jgi:hypothetical protein